MRYGIVTPDGFLHEFATLEQARIVAKGSKWFCLCPVQR